jgi:hypothetical protein
MTSLSFEPLRVIIIAAVLALVGIRVYYWLAHQDHLPGLEGNSSLSGRVVRSDGRPVANALVTLDGSPTRPARSSTYSVTDGRYSLQGLPAGVYDITAGFQANDLLSGSFGEVSVGFGGTLVKLGDSESLTGLDITLWPAAEISGTITLDNGRAASRCDVEAIATTPTMRNWRRGGMPFSGNAVVQTRVTDDRGRYRMSFLGPGVYLIGATCPDPLVGMGFHPAATESAAAGLVGVEAGRVYEDVNVRLGKVPTATLAGTIVSSDGRPVAAEVWLERIGPMTNRRMDLVSDGAGRFSIPNVPPGEFRLVAYSKTVAEAQWGRMMVESDGRSIPPVILRLEPGSLLTLQLIDQRRTRESSVVAKTSRRLEPADEATRQWSWRITKGHTYHAEGRDTIRELPPGRYRLSLQPPLGTTVDRLTLNGANWLDTPLEIRPGDGYNVEATLVDAGELSGRLDSTIAVQPDLLVAVFPSDPALRVPSRRMQVVHPLPDGRFYLFNLPPGDYLITVARRPDPGMWLMPSYLTLLENTAAPVHVTAGNTSISLPLR